MLFNRDLLKNNNNQGLSTCFKAHQINEMHQNHHGGGNTGEENQHPRHHARLKLVMLSEMAAKGNRPDDNAGNKAQKGQLKMGRYHGLPFKRFAYDCKPEVR